MIKLFNSRISVDNMLLDKYQCKAVLCNKKSYLVVAGAGSGKTLTIVAKVQNLIKNNINEKNILCISFTNETVNSLCSSLKKRNINVDVKTFHKLSLDILKREFKICSNNLLEYVTDEYFYSYIYFDSTCKLIPYIEKLDYIKKIIVNFIHQLKSMNYDEFYILSLINNKNIDSDKKIILILIFKIYLIYKEELVSINSIDFDDIINLAVKKIDSMRMFKYTHVIIDEYQDVSFTKYLLIKKLMNKFKINLMAVGDDYQSIYSFTGCNLSLFTKFKKYFPKSKIIKLKYTYRNSSDIVEISKRFIWKNKNQINKHLKSLKYIKDPINIVYIKEEKSAFEFIVKDLDNILILGRNNKDIDNLIESGVIKKESDSYVYLEAPYKKINFLTVHSSKGLEEDNVIILNVIDDVLGFPNKIKENEIFTLLHNNNQLEEERRLFYVALTRAKSRVYIFTEKNKESLFVKELIKDFKLKLKIIDLSQKNFK